MINKLLRNLLSKQILQLATTTLKHNHPFTKNAKTLQMSGKSYKKSLIFII